MSEGLRNPAAAAAVDKFMETEAGQKAVGSALAGLKFLLITGGVLGVGYLANKQYKKWRAKKYLTDRAAELETQVAVMMYKAMFTLPRDMGWFSITIPDGTDEEMLNQLGRKDLDLNKVARAYKIIFDKVLIQDVNSELSGSEIWKFFNNVNSTGSDANTPAADLVPFYKGEPVYVRKKDGPLVTRKAVKQSNGAWKITNDSRGSFEFAQKIGVVYDIVRYPNKEIDYIIDQDWSADSIHGFTVANHRDLLNKNPEE